MKTHLNPYLHFNDGRCREAMEFYRGVFGGTIELQTVAESPMANEMAKDKQGLIMHAALTSGDVFFMAADMMRDKAVVGDSVSIAVHCSSEKELNEHFAKLKEGGDVFMAPESVPWGAIYAMVTDKYGIEWLLNFQKEPMKK
jgi:PhnB protein